MMFFVLLLLNYQIINVDSFNFHSNQPLYLENELPLFGKTSHLTLQIFPNKNISTYIIGKYLQLAAGDDGGDLPAVFLAHEAWRCVKGPVTVVNSSFCLAGVG